MHVNPPPISHPRITLNRRLKFPPLTPQQTRNLFAERAVAKHYRPRHCRRVPPQAQRRVNFNVQKHSNLNFPLPIAATPQPRADLRLVVSGHQAWQQLLRRILLSTSMSPPVHPAASPLCAISRPHFNSFRIATSFITNCYTTPSLSSIISILSPFL